MVFFACLFAVIERDSITGGLVGLSISYSMQVNNKIDVVLQAILADIAAKSSDLNVDSEKV